MYSSRVSPEFTNGVEEFRRVALEHKRAVGSTTVFCPCRDCENIKRWENFDLIEEHLYLRGFTEKYEVWFWHGEKYPSTVTEQVEYQQSCDEGSDNGNGNDGNVENEGNEEDEDRIDDNVDDLRAHFGEKPEDYENVAKAAQTPLFPGCSKYSKLSAILTLFNIKADGNWSDSSFTRLLEALADMFPDGNDIPKSTYFAKN